MTKYQYLLASAMAVLASPSLAEPVMIHFIARSVNATEVFMTGDADGIIDLKSTWDPIDAAGGPLAGLHGPCFGTARISGGLMTGDGYCAYKDAEGNTAIVHWWMDNTADFAGAWTLAGGTGPWASASGGGLWADTPGESPDVGMTHITGMVSMQ